jgi:putative transposase
VGAGGTVCRRSTRTTARSTGRSSGGSARGSSTGSGRWSRKRARTWAAATGSGRRPTARCGRRVWGDLIGPNPTDRAKSGVKRSLLVEADGGPLAVVVAGANVPDARLLEKTIEAVALERPPVEEGWPQHLCLDKGYDNGTGWGACIDHDYDPHIALIRDERPSSSKPHKPRGWIVERTFSWLLHGRRLARDYERLTGTDEALIYVSMARLMTRRLARTALIPFSDSLSARRVKCHESHRIS